MAFKYLFLDLDGTIYPHNNGLWEAIAARMEMYMHEELGIPQADIPATRQGYFRQYGTTLKGLMHNYPVDPQQFLTYVHDVPLDKYLKADARLRSLLLGIPQPKWILTNSDKSHAARVLETLGVTDLFSDILDITYMDYENKPNPAVFQKAMAAAGSTQPSECVFVDDIPQNVAEAKRLGWRTVLVGAHENNGAADTHIQEIYSLVEALQEVEDGR